MFAKEGCVLTDKECCPVCSFVTLIVNFIYFLISAIGTITPGVLFELSDPHHASCPFLSCCFTDNSFGRVRESLKKKKKVHCIFFDCVTAASGAAAVWGRRQHSKGTAGGTLCSANADVGDAGETAAREWAAGTEGRWPLFYFCLGEQLWKDLNPKGCF